MAKILSNNSHLPIWGNNENKDLYDFLERLSNRQSTVNEINEKASNILIKTNRGIK